jgi:hypothetical protein
MRSRGIDFAPQKGREYVTLATVAGGLAPVLVFVSPSMGQETEAERLLKKLLAPPQK